MSDWKTSVIGDYIAFLMTGLASFVALSCKNCIHLLFSLLKWQIKSLNEIGLCSYFKALHFHVITVRSPSVEFDPLCNLTDKRFASLKLD